MNRTSHSKVIIGVTFILVGLVLLGRSVGLFYFSFHDLIRNLIPLSLVALGIWLILRKRRHEEQMREWYHRTTFHSGYTTSESDASSTTSSGFTHAGVSATYAEGRPTSLKYSKFIGDLHINCADLSLQHVEISMAIGDVEVLLAGGKLHPGLNRMIVSTFIGDVRIFIPKDMPYFVRCSSFLGDILVKDKKEEGFGNTIESQSPTYETADAKLYLVVSHFIGDIKVYEV